MSDDMKMLRAENNGIYNLKLNRQQLETIASSLECTTRMRCGQLELSKMPPIQEEFFAKYDKLGGNVWSEVRDEIETHLNRIKWLIWEIEPNASYGIGYSGQSDLEYEMYKTILSRFESEIESRMRIEGKIYHGNVHTGTPLKRTDVPFIEVEPVADENIHEKIKRVIRKENEIKALKKEISEIQEKCTHDYIDYGMNSKFLYLSCIHCGKIIEVDHEVVDICSIKDTDLIKHRKKIVNKYNRISAKTK